jgi:hypothetical protein
MRSRVCSPRLAAPNLVVGRRVEEPDEAERVAERGDRETEMTKAQQDSTGIGADYNTTPSRCAETRPGRRLPWWQRRRSR